MHPPTAALPRTATHPFHSDAGGVWRHVAIRGDAWRAQGLLHRATVDGDEGETLRSGKTNAAVIAESAVQASRRARYTRVYTWHAPLRSRHVSQVLQLPVAHFELLGTVERSMEMLRHKYTTRHVSEPELAARHLQAKITSTLPRVTSA